MPRCRAVTASVGRSEIAQRRHDDMKGFVADLRQKAQFADKLTVRHLAHLVDCQIKE